MTIVIAKGFCPVAISLYKSSLRGSIGAVAVALNQSAFALSLRFLGEPCMGAVYQIRDLDSTSQSQPL